MTEEEKQEKTEMANKLAKELLAIAWSSKLESDVILAAVNALWMATGLTVFTKTGLLKLVEANIKTIEDHESES